MTRIDSGEPSRPGVPQTEALPNPLLDVRDLRVVIAVADAGTTARAAAGLHLTQSAVSRALLGAEGRLGAQLFDRTPRGLVPTSAGERMVAEGRRILGEIAALERSLRAPVPAITRLRVVCGCYTAYHWLPSTLVRLRSSLPELEVALAVEHTLTPVEALRSGDVDVALLTGRDPCDPDEVELESRPLFTDEVVFVVSRDHPLAGRDTLSRADLTAHRLVTTHAPQGEARWFLGAVFGRTRPNARFELLPLTEAVIDFARAGLAVAILSEWVVGPHLARGPGGLVVKRLASGPLHRPWTLGWRRDVREAALGLHRALVDAPTVALADRRAVAR